MDIQPIQTRYRGVLFRSRLEARWAVFFDSIKIKWEYEPEGFRLANGEGYLPDFYLPEVRWFAEIKPTFRTFLTHDKARRFVETTKLPVLLLDGPPTFKSYTGLSFEAPAPLPQPDIPYSVADSDDGVLVNEFSLDVTEYNRRYQLEEHRLFSDPWYPTDRPMEENFSRPYIDAVEAALSARFE